MKIKIYLFPLFLLLSFSFVSCSKFGKMLNIELSDMEVDGNLNFGIPLMNADYNIEKILNQFGRMGYIKYQANGDYYFEYFTAKSEYASALKYNRINSNQYLLLDYPLPKMEHTFVDNFIDISSEDMRIDRAILKSGQMEFNFSNVDIDPASSSIDYEITITSHSMFNPDGSSFLLKLSKSSPIGFAACAGLEIITQESQINFIISVSLKQAPTGTNKLIFYPSIRFSNTSFSQADVEILKEYPYSFETASAFSVFPTQSNFNVTLHNLKLYMDATNTFGKDASIIISKAYLKGKTLTESILLHDDTQITIPKNYSGFIDISKYMKNEINLSSRYDSIFFQCTSSVPLGKVTIYDNSYVAAGMKFSLPFDFTIDEVVFRDTTSFQLSNLRNLAFLDTVKMRTEIKNSIPSDFAIQVWLYNSITKEITDSLMFRPMIIKGSYDGNLTPSEIQFIYFTNDRLMKLKQANQMILQVSLTTNGMHRTFNQKNCIQAKVGAHIRTASHL